MVNDKDPFDDDAIEVLLSDLAEPAPDPSDALLGRVLGDAYSEQPVQLTPAKVRRRRVSVLSVLGGWSGLGGLAVAASIGFFLGFSPPALLEDQLSLMLGSELGSLDVVDDAFDVDVLFEDDFAS